MIETPVVHPSLSSTFADNVISSKEKLPSLRYNLLEFWLDVK